MAAELKEVTMTGRAAGSFFLNEIKQVFVNDSNRNVEFIYTFPMPENASICSFSAFTGSNRFVGAVAEKGQALKSYQRAIFSGDSAYMLESHRSNIYQVSLGNVAGGETITVNISYIQDIKISGDEYRKKVYTKFSSLAPRFSVFETEDVFIIPGSAIYIFLGTRLWAFKDHAKQGSTYSKYAASRYEKYSSIVVGDFTPAILHNLLGDAFWAGFDTRYTKRRRSEAASRIP